MGEVSDLEKARMAREARKAMSNAIPVFMPYQEPPPVTAPWKCVRVEGEDGHPVFIHWCESGPEAGSRMVDGVITPPHEVPYVVAALMEALASMGHPVVPAPEVAE